MPDWLGLVAWLVLAGMFLGLRYAGAGPREDAPRRERSGVHGLAEEVRRHGLLNYLVAFGFAAFFLLVGLQDEEDRLLLWAFAAIAVVGRIVAGDPLVTVEILSEGIATRGFGRRALIPKEDFRDVLYGSGEHSYSRRTHLWLREALAPNEVNDGSSRFVVLVLRRRRWGLGKRLLIPTEGPTEAEALVATLRRALMPSTSYRSAG